MAIVPGSVLKIDEQQGGADSVSGGGDSTRSYVETWQAQTDDPEDDASVILDAAAMPQYGDVLNGIPLRSRRAKRGASDSIRTYWKLTATYSFQADVGEPVDNTGQPTTDPLLDRGSVSVTHATKRVPVQQAQYIGMVDASGNDLVGQDPPWGVRGNIEAIANAAGTPTLPFPEIDKPIQIVRTSGTWPTWDNSWSTFYNTVNDAPVTISWFLAGNNVPIDFGPYAARTLRVDSVDAEDFDYGNTIFFRRNIEFWYDPDGWYDDLANIGKMASILPGDPKPEGGGATYSASEILNGYLTKTDAVPGVGVEGETILEDRWLDKDGKFIKDMSAGGQNYIRWLIYEEVDFTTIITIVSP